MTHCRSRVDPPYTAQWAQSTPKARQSPLCEHCSQARVSSGTCVLILRRPVFWPLKAHSSMGVRPSMGFSVTPRLRVRTSSEPNEFLAISAGSSGPVHPLLVCIRDKARSPADVWSRAEYSTHTRISRRSEGLRRNPTALASNAHSPQLKGVCDMRNRSLWHRCDCTTAVFAVPSFRRLNSQGSRTRTLPQVTPTTKTQNQSSRCVK